MKKSRLLLALPVAMAVLLSACTPSTTTTTSGTSEDPTTTTTSEPDPTTTDPTTTTTEPGPSGDHFISEATTITFWSTFNDSYQTVIQNIAAAFKEIEPNVTVNIVKQSGSYDDIADLVIQGFAVNNYPDMVVSYPDHVANYINYNKALDVEPYMTDANYGWTDEDFDDILPNFLEEGESYSIPGVYSLPFAKSTEAMFYNEDVLIGLNLATIDPTINNGLPLTHDYLNNLTWEELFNKLCPAILRYNTEVEQILLETEAYHAVFGYDSDDNLFITLAQQYGYDYTALDQNTGYAEVLFNNDGMKGLMKKFNSYYNDGYLITKGTSEGGYTNSFFTKRNTLFSVGSTGGYKYQADGADFNVGVANIPHAEGKERYVINQGPSISILKSTASDANNRALASWLFYKFLTNTTNSTYWATETGYMPVRYSVYETEAFMDYANTDGKPQMSTELLGAKTARFSQVVSSSDELFFSPVFKGSSEARQQVGSIMTQSLLQPEADFTDTWLNGIFEKAVNETLLAMS